MSLSSGCSPSSNRIESDGNMAGSVLVCDQAIFTSIRSPMGEGYRIVASSRGLKTDEKQTITRQSPSHDALCDAGEDSHAAQGASFYSLPSKRLCVALTCNAGAEHTARGGQRVYTHNVILSAEDFARCDYNPFVVWRAMKAAGLTTPQLSPPATLATIELQFDLTSTPAFDEPLRDLLTTPRRLCAARCLLESKPVAVDITTGWIPWAEALLLAVPGPMRSKCSFSAGLRFSVGRGHRFQIFRDEKRAAAGRASAQGICFVNAESSDEVVPSAWLSFVERLWSGGELGRLTKRTSRTFTDTTVETRERIGRLYGVIDDLPQRDTAAALASAMSTFAEPARGIEGDIQGELRHAVQDLLCSRFADSPFAETIPHWNAIITLCRRGSEAASFARPLVDTALRAAMRDDPMTAAEIALDCTRDFPAGEMRKSLEPLFDQILAALRPVAAESTATPNARLATIVNRWCTLRPACPIVRELTDSCAALPNHA